MKRIFLLIAIFSPFWALSQDLTGIWRGYFYEMIPMKDAQGKNIMERGERYKFEVQMDHQAKQIKGVTYSYLQTQFYGKAALTGTFSNKSQKVLLQETKMLEVKMMGMETTCIMTCFLQYSKIDTTEVLEGNYISMNSVDSSNCGRGRVLLKKVTTTDFHKEPFLLNKNRVEHPQTVEKQSTTKAIQKNLENPNTDVPLRNTLQKQIPLVRQDNDSILSKPIHVPEKSSPTPSILTTRSNPLVKELVLPPGDITIKIYDNGTIDNDTVTVYLDNSPILSKKRLTDKAIQYSFRLDEKQPVRNLVMVAENLGLYPPNTSLMIIEAGQKTFEVRISSNEENNALIRFRVDSSIK